MSERAESDLQERQREVQRLLGRCMLRLQQYERLLKAIVAHHDISGPASSLETIRAARIADAAGKTLGSLVGQFLGSYVVTDGTDTSADSLGNAAEEAIFFGMRMRLSLSTEDHGTTLAGLKELVSLRNNLVHHFIKQHDLWSATGCREARTALVAAYARIDQHFEQLRGWAEHMDRARRFVAEFVQSDTFLDLVIHGIAPDGSVDWTAAGIVRALHEASVDLTEEGWTSVARAGQWISQRYPEQLPTKYGCASWRQVVHESRLFELRYREVDGQRSAWYRAYRPLAVSASP